MTRFQSNWRRRWRRLHDKFQKNVLLVIFVSISFLCSTVSSIVLVSIESSLLQLLQCSSLTVIFFHLNGRAILKFSTGILSLPLVLKTWIVVVSVVFSLVSPFVSEGFPTHPCIIIECNFEGIESTTTNDCLWMNAVLKSRVPFAWVPDVQKLLPWSTRIIFSFSFKWWRQRHRVSSIGREGWSKERNEDGISLLPSHKPFLFASLTAVSDTKVQLKPKSCVCSFSFFPCFLFLFPIQEKILEFSRTSSNTSFAWF